MARMRRRLLTALSFLSLAMCLVFALGWMRGRFASDFFDYGRGDGFLTVVIIDQSLLVILCHFEPPEHQGFTWSRNRADPGYTSRNNPTIWGKLGFYTYRHEERDETGFTKTRIVGVPFWLLCLVTAVPPLTFLNSTRKRRIRIARVKANRCSACGYNLTGNTSGVCPECGTPTTERVKA
jgi:hypothetical protein